MKIVSRHVVQIEGRIFAQCENVSVGIIHHRAHHAFWRKLSDGVCNRAFDYCLNARVYRRHKIETAHGRKIVFAARQRFAHQIRFCQNLPVYTGKVFVVIRFEPRLTVTVRRAKTDKLRHEVAIRIISEIVFRIVYSAETACIDCVQLFFRHTRCDSHFTHSFRDFFKSFLILVSERVAKKFRNRFFVFRVPRSDIQIVSRRGRRKHFSVSIQNSATRRVGRHVSQPLRSCFYLQIAAVKNYHRKHFAENRTKQKDHQQ